MCQTVQLRILNSLSDRESKLLFSIKTNINSNGFRKEKTCLAFHMGMNPLNVLISYNILLIAKDQ